jgi:N-acetylglucosamine repressor
VALEQTQRTGADRSVMRDLNRSLVLDILREQSPISRASIAKVAQLTKPTISAIVDDLISEGLVTELGIGATTTAGGRPPILLEFNERSQFVVGVHIGVRLTTIIVADAKGAELGRVVDPTPKGKPPAQLRAVSKRLLEALDAHGADIARLAAVGVGVPGLTDFLAGVCLLAPNLGWRDVPVGPIMSEEIGVPVFVHHSGQTTVVAEQLEGAAQGFDNVALLYTGSGLGAGVIVDGKVFQGARGIAAEVGHCKIPGNDEPCTCGGVGCLETVASARAIVRFAKDALAKGKTRSALTGVELTPESVAAAAAAGDALAMDVITRIGRNLGFAASWLANIFNPEVMVVSGGLVNIGELLMTPLREAAGDAMLPAVKTEIRDSQLGADAEVRGAVLLAMQQSQSFYRLLFQG